MRCQWTRSAHENLSIGAWARHVNLMGSLAEEECRSSRNGENREFERVHKPHAHYPDKYHLMTEADTQHMHTTSSQSQKSQEILARARR